MQVNLIGQTQPALIHALEAAGFELVPEADLQLLPWDDLEARSSLRQSGQNDVLVIALVTERGDVQGALDSGASDAWIGHDDLDLLRIRAGALLNLHRAWQRRLSAHEQRARRTLSELQSTRDLLGRLIDATPNPVMAADMRGRVLVFNRAAEVALGYESAWAREHMHVTDIYADPTDARRVLSEIRNTPGGLAHHIEIRLRARSGEQIPVVLSTAEVYAADGIPIATVGVFDDQRPEIALKHRLEETTEQLIATEKRAAAMEVAGAAAHELNQPLTAVMGTLELLGLRSDLPDDVHRRLEKGYEQLERMAEIVRSLARTTRPRSIGYVGQTRILDLRSGREGPDQT